MRDGLAARADARQATAMQAYMKSAMPYRSALGRRFVRARADRLSPLSQREALRNVDAPNW